MVNSSEYAKNGDDLGQNEPRYVALADQVQKLVMESDIPIVAFVLISADGNAEYRSPLGFEKLKEILTEAAEKL